MSGNGKYTKYTSEASDKNTLLNKLFKSGDKTKRSIVQDLVGKENEARDIIVALAREVLTPAHQVGDLGMFPQGVELNFAGAPDLTTVTHASAGGPASPYFPDITSPGPGKTSGLDKVEDPEIKTTDIKPVYVPGSPDGGTKSPSTTNAKIVEANKLGTAGKLGDSGGNV